MLRRRKGKSWHTWNDLILPASERTRAQTWTARSTTRCMVAEIVAVKAFDRSSSISRLSVVASRWEEKILSGISSSPRECIRLRLFRSFEHGREAGL